MIYIISMVKTTIITPSYRIDNLKKKIEQSTNFEYIDEWIIVYDGTKIESQPSIFEQNEKIKEYIYINVIVYQVMDKGIMHQLKLQILIHYCII